MILQALVKYYDIAGITEKSDHDILQAAWDIKQKLLKECVKKEAVQIFHYTQKMSEFVMVGNSSQTGMREFAQRVEQAFPIEEYGPISVVLYQKEEKEEADLWQNIGKIYRELITALVQRLIAMVKAIRNAAAVTIPAGETTWGAVFIANGLQLILAVLLIVLGVNIVYHSFKAYKNAEHNSEARV